jgi:hypothetical protein
MRPFGMDRELIVVATLVILTGIALGIRAPLSMGDSSPRVMLSIPGGR